MGTVRVGILGFGYVGRVAAMMLAESSWATLTAITEADDLEGQLASDAWDRREGEWARLYERQPRRCPDNVRGIKFTRSNVDELSGKVDAVISALPDNIAARVEVPLAKKGTVVSSHSSQNRWHEDAQLVIPAANYKDITKVSGRLPLICTPNCTTPLFVPLVAVLMVEGYKIESLGITTVQATSGKGDAATNPEYVRKTRNRIFNDWGTGYGGLSGEAWVTTSEPWKMLGMVSSLEQAQMEQDNIREGRLGRPTNVMPIHATTTRNGSAEIGHVGFVTLRFRHTVNVEEIISLVEKYRLPESLAFLPSAPEKYFIVTPGMPDTRDLNDNNGMSVLVGDFMQRTRGEVSFTAVVNNLVAGAAGNAILNLELYLAHTAKLTSRSVHA